MILMSLFSNLLGYVFTNTNMERFDKVITEIKWCSFLPHSVRAIHGWVTATDNFGDFHHPGFHGATWGRQRTSISL